MRSMTSKITLVLLLALFPGMLLHGPLWAKSKKTEPAPAVQEKDPEKGPAAQKEPQGGNPLQKMSSSDITGKYFMDAIQAIQSETGIEISVEAPDGLTFSQPISEGIAGMNLGDGLKKIGDESGQGRFTSEVIEEKGTLLVRFKAIPGAEPQTTSYGGGMGTGMEPGMGGPGGGMGPGMGGPGGGMEGGMGTGMGGMPQGGMGAGMPPGGMGPGQNSRGMPGEDASMEGTNLNIPGGMNSGGSPGGGMGTGMGGPGGGSGRGGPGGGSGMGGPGGEGGPPNGGGRPDGGGRGSGPGGG